MSTSAQKTSSMEAILSQLPVTLADIRIARERIQGEVAETPLKRSKRLSSKFGINLWLKCENYHTTSSFKERGACNRLSQLSEEQKNAGITAVSAGNHAQGLAYHAKRLNIPAVIVMPATAPITKISRTRDYGAEVVLHGKTFAEAATLIPELVEKRGLTLVHAFDDIDVISGQGTIGLEIIEALPNIDTLVVPIGGGGLISGIAIAAKSLKPNITIIGVQAALYPSMVCAVKGGDMPRDGGSSIAEGIAIKEPGKITRPIVEALVDDLVLVSEDQIEDAVALLLDNEKMLVEGAGAAGIAAIMANPERFSGQNVATVLCGGNIDQSILVSALQRALVRQGRFVRLQVKAPDTVGLLSSIASAIAEHGGNIMDVHHDRVFSNPGAKTTTIVVDIELQAASQKAKIIQKLEEKGMHVE